VVVVCCWSPLETAAAAVSACVKARSLDQTTTPCITKQSKNKKDPAVDDAARLLRVLYLRDLQRLQADVTAAVTAAQVRRRVFFCALRV
jgi:hypothetical protein